MGLKLISSLTVFVVVVGIIFKIYLTLELSPILSTAFGEIQGTVLKSRNGRQFYGYYGIPFAKPPVGERRFQAPEKAENWEGIWDGTYYRLPCIQFDFMLTGFTAGSEDCLYLNVFVPKLDGRTKSKGFPVMVHIHGGYFHMGTTVTQGPHFFMDHDVIIVTVAYRVGILGFLNTGDGVVRGNMGLKDQNMALRWVQENIKSFGGDPDRVTLFGESAGGVSVHHHMLSPQSKGLFSRAIRQSGSALNYWGLMEGPSPSQRAKEFSQRFNCPLDTMQNMVSCLRNLDASTLVAGHIDLMERPTPQASKFVPSIETVKDKDAFLTEEPLKLIESGKFNRVPLLSGFSTDEGIFHAVFLAANETKLQEATGDWFNWAPKAFHYPPDRTDVSQKLFDFYIAPYTQSENRRELLQNLSNAYGDRLFNYGIVTSVQHEQKHLEDVYNYIYDHHGGFSLGKLLAIAEDPIHPVIGGIWMTAQAFVWNYILGIEFPLSDFPGTCHGDELSLLWHFPFFSVFFSEKKDLQHSKDLVQLWVDFATDTKPLQFRDIAFPSSGIDKPLKFMRLNQKNVEILQDPFSTRIQFWERLGL